MDAKEVRDLVGRLRHSWLENQVRNKSADEVVAIWREGPWNALERDFPAHLARARALARHLASAYSPARWVERLLPLAALPEGERRRLARALDGVYRAGGGLGDLPKRIEECTPAVERARAVVVRRWQARSTPEAEEQLVASWSAFHEEASRLHGLLQELPSGPCIPECAEMYLEMLPVENEIPYARPTENTFEQQHAWSICALVEKELECAGIADFEAFIEILYIQSRGPGIAVIVHEYGWDVDKYFPLVGDCFEALFDAKSSTSSSEGGGETKPSISAMDDFYFDTETPVWYARSDKEDNGAGGSSLGKDERKMTVIKVPLESNHYIARGRGYEMGKGHPTDNQYRKFFALYAKKMHEEFFGPSVAVGVMVVPVAMRHEDPEFQEKLGAVFLHLGTNEGIELEVLERIYARIQSYWHFNMTSEILARRTAERDEALDRERLFSLALGAVQRLSDSFQEAQDAAQELRGIVYPPYGAFAAAVPNVLEYFAEGSAVQVGGEMIEIKHKPSDYGTSDGAAILLAILARVFGSDLRRFLSIGSLFSHVDGLVYGDTSTHRGIRTICKAIVGEKNEDTWGCVRDSAMPAGVGQTKGSPLGEPLRRFKLALHAPYKYEANGCTIVPLACLVLVSGGTLSCRMKERDDFVPFGNLRKFFTSDFTRAKLWENDPLPVPRSAFLWAAVESAVGEEVTVEVTRDVGLIKVTGPRGPGPSRDCLVKMKDLVNVRDAFYEGGDDTREWYRFASACSKGWKADLKEENKLSKLLLRHGNSTMTISHLADGFSIALSTRPKRGAK